MSTDSTDTNNTNVHAFPSVDIPLSPSGLPSFEGQPVVGAKMKLAGATNLETPPVPSRIDDPVRLLVQGVVTRVDHVVDEKRGTIHRVHTVRVLECVMLDDTVDTENFFA